MPEPEHSDGLQDAMQAFIKADSIRDWHDEAFVWPSVTIGTATLIYTLTEWGFASSGRFELARFRVSGELVGAGGMLFAALLLTSLAARLREWEKLARPYYTPSKEVNTLKITLEDGGRWLWLLVCVAMALTWIFVVAQVFIAHHNTRGQDALKATLALVLGNILVACTTRAFCLKKLYLAKELIIVIHMEYLRAHRRSAPAAGTSNGQGSAPGPGAGGGGEAAPAAGSAPAVQPQALDGAPPAPGERGGA